MTINIVVCGTFYKGKLAIGSGGRLLFELKRDLSEFKKLTWGKIVVMGRKTWDSLPLGSLPGRPQFVITKNVTLQQSRPFLGKAPDHGDHCFISMERFLDFYQLRRPTVMVIGGEVIYEKFLPVAENIFLTHVLRPPGLEPDAFFPLDSFRNFALNSSSSILKEDGCEFCFLRYQPTRNKETPVLKLLENVVAKGNLRVDRTNIGTYSVFGEQLRFDIRHCIPLLTTKRVAFKSVVNELLWILQGHTDANILEKRGVTVWREHTSRAFLDSRGLHHYPEGSLGPGYGFQLRHFGANYATTVLQGASDIGGFDQLEHIEHLLKTDPFSRRMLISFWNPAANDEIALMPCHYSVQFYVEECLEKPLSLGRSGLNDFLDHEGETVKYLSCHFTMRSNDLMCGFPWNIASYSILTHLLAFRCGMLPKDIIYTCGDAHIYKNHMDQAREQWSRTPRPFPALKLDDSLREKDWAEMTAEDFQVAGYFPHPAIHSPMAV